MHFPLIRFLPVFTVALSLTASCGGGKKGPERFDIQEETLTAAQPVLDLLAPEKTGVSFQNSITETYEDNITTNINKYNGGGMAVGDFNNDNLPDLYFINCSGKNALYLNKGSLRFEDITDAAGVGSEDGFETAATVVDINADGFLDIYVCRGGVEKNDARRNRLYINNGNLTFTERAKEYGLDDKSANTGANFFDYDNDGDLDCYLLSYPTEAIYTNKIEAKLGPDGKYHPQLYPRAEYDTDRLYRNDAGKFTDVSEASGIWNLAYGLSVSVTDINRDGWTDIYVGNDFIQPDLLYINDHKGHFTDQLAQYFRHCSQHTMGTDLTDFDNDGFIDLFAVDMLAVGNFRQKTFLATNPQSRYTAMVQNGYFEPVVRNVLQRNNGNGTFSDVACMAGVLATDWSWSGLLFDIDNDGLRDLHVTNGYRREVTNRDFIDYTLPEIQRKVGFGKRLRDIYPNFDDFLQLVPTFKVRNFCFQNLGNWNFRNVSGDWLTMPPSWSSGAVWSDLDADGDLDLVVNNLEEPAFVYENKAKGKTGAHYLQLKLKGSAANPFAVGASVLIQYAGNQQYQELYPTRGIFSSVEHLIHFGLGPVAKIDKLTVRWPDGKTQTLTGIEADQRLTLQYKDAAGYIAALSPAPPQGGALLKEMTGQLAFEHKENQYNDFEAYPLQPWSLSDMGPLMAKGDVNADGLEDLFIGNGFGEPAALFLQQPDGRLKPAPDQKAFLQDRAYETHGAVFFDADGDGDLDLLALSGGPEADVRFVPIAWQNRLYLNDGKGAFTRNAQALPQTEDLALRAAAYDYDGDGDQDLFIGGRVLPTKWPMPARSYVLRNDGGKFSDVTKEVAPAFERLGLITDLQFADLDGDKTPELVVVGEWMPVNVFQLQGGKLSDATARFGLDNTNGLWNRLLAADLDGDGDQDLVTGNLGLNTRFTASVEAPLRCYAKDFDNNGTIDPIMAWHEGGKIYPVVQKEVLIKQMPILKKKFLYAKEYGQATLDKVWPQADLDKALNLRCNVLTSCWWENQNGKMVRHDFPPQAQISPVMGVAAADLNGDSKTDLVLTGNKYGYEVETNRCDAGNGAVLLGSDNGFRWANNLESGFWSPFEARDLALLGGKNSRKIVIAVSNSRAKAQLFTGR